MATKEKLKTFGVWAKCNNQVIVEVSAKTLEEAVEKAKALDEDQFISINGEYVDGSFKLTGVLEND